MGRNMPKTPVQFMWREKHPNGFSPVFNLKAARQARAFHVTLPGYGETQLRSLGRMAKLLKVGDILVKDESSRFGLNAFKALGGSYSLAKAVAQQLFLDENKITFGDLTSEANARILKDLTVVTATDGNHGRGIAWIAKLLGMKCIVFMPKGSAQERLNNIRALGAKSEILDMNYDDAVRFAKQTADKNGNILVQDTSWDGYEQIPQWIMQGYLTIVAELADQVQERKPTHIFLQAGVGAMAGSLCACLAEVFQETRPVITIVEPTSAGCIYKTAKAGDGKLHCETELNTIMAGLSCGEPCSLGWHEIDRFASGFALIDDEVAATGMRVLGAPLEGDPRIISGESGAATFGFVFETLVNPRHESIKARLGLTDDSVVLCVSTEGATDIRNYLDIVWGGKYANPL